MRTFLMVLALCLFVGMGVARAEDVASDVRVVGNVRKILMQVPGNVGYCGPYFFGSVDSNPYSTVAFNIEQGEPPPAFVKKTSETYILGFTIVPIIITRGMITVILDEGAVVPHATYVKRGVFTEVEIRIALRSLFEAPCLVPGHRI